MTLPLKRPQAKRVDQLPKIQKLIGLESSSTALIIRKRDKTQKIKGILPFYIELVKWKGGEQKMTLRSPEHQLDIVFSSSISYSLEILECDNDNPLDDKLASQVNNFLEKAAQINEIKHDKEAIIAFSKEYKGLNYE